MRRDRKRSIPLFVHMRHLRMRVRNFKRVFLIELFNSIPLGPLAPWVFGRILGKRGKRKK